jgi:hypothetical protein
VNGFLQRRHLNVGIQTEIPPQCAVTTGLLLALHHTAHGKKDVLDLVIEMDDHPWLSVPADSSHDEKESIVKKCRKALHSRIANVLSKLTGQTAKDRAKLVRSGSDPADISSCLNCLLRNKYVSMNEKQVVSRKKPTTHVEIVVVSASVSTSQSIGEVAGSRNFGHPVLPTRNEE